MEFSFTHSGILDARMSIRHRSAASRSFHNSIYRLALLDSYIGN